MRYEQDSAGCHVGTVDRDAASRSIYQRPTEATATIANSHNKYDGTFRLNYRSRICGEIPPEASLTGERVFIIEFPDDDAPNPEITNVTFGSNTLVAGATRATVFRLNVSVQSPKIGAPPAYVLNTDQPKNSGTAQLTLTPPGTTTLKVAGTNDMGETIDLTVVCLAAKATRSEPGGLWPRGKRCE